MSARSERRRLARDRFKNEQRYEAPADSEPDGKGFLQAWVPQTGVTFLANGAFVRSIIDPKTDEGLVAFDIDGKWNHAAKDTLSVICHRDVAREMGQYLLDAADAAKRDEIEWRNK